MFGEIALGVLGHPLELIHFLVCTTRVLRSGSKKVPKHLKINGLGRFRGTHFWGSNLGEKRSHAAWRSFSVFPKRSHAARRSFWSAPMQRGAHFLWERESLGEPWRVLTDREGLVLSFFSWFPYVISTISCSVSLHIYRAPP